MSTSVSVHWLPRLFSPDDLQGGVAVVIDVLRASTTIAQALAAGAEAVIPCGEVAEAENIAANLPRDSYLLGGERGGVKIPGFDLGNSPREYAPEIVSGKMIVFTTTNGTQALKRCEHAERILVGSFANLDAITQAADQTGLPVHLVCAGTEGAISAEDVLCAGAFVARLQTWRGGNVFRENDASRLALELYRSRSQDEAVLLESLKESAGGRNLLALGYEADIQWAAKCNRLNLVSEYDHHTGRIEADEPRH